MTRCLRQFLTKMSSLMWYLLSVTLITSGIVSANESSTENMKVSSCNITGVWRNELGSTLRMTAEGSEVRGVFQTAVESVRGAAGSNRAARVLGIVGNGTQPAVSFSVLWEKGSCSVWVGQCFVLRDGAQVLKTLWMLRNISENLAGDWGSTKCGIENCNRIAFSSSPTAPFGHPNLHLIFSGRKYNDLQYCWGFESSGCGPASPADQTGAGKRQLQDIRRLHDP